MALGGFDFAVGAAGAEDFGLHGGRGSTVGDRVRRRSVSGGSMGPGRGATTQAMPPTIVRSAA